MVTCNNCGHQNAGGNYICRNCGHVVNQHTQKNVRPNVNNKISREDARQVSKNNIRQQRNKQHTQKETVCEQSEQSNVNQQLNYSNTAYNPNNNYTKEMYQQQAYGVITNCKRGKKAIILTVGMITAEIMFIAAIIGIRIASKFIKSKTYNKNSYITESKINSEPIRSGTLYSSETQTIYNEYNIAVTTNLADATVENKDLHLKINIDNQTDTEINIKIQGIMANATVGNSSCDDIISIGSNSNETKEIFIDTDNSIEEPLYNIEFKLYMYSDDESVKIITDNCMIKDLNTNQPVVLKAFTNTDKSILPLLISNTNKKDNKTGEKFNINIMESL
jgi:hypothetical protein